MVALWWRACSQTQSTTVSQWRVGYCERILVFAKRTLSKVDISKLLQLSSVLVDAILRTNLRLLEEHFSFNRFCSNIHNCHRSLTILSLDMHCWARLRINRAMTGICSGWSDLVFSFEQYINFVRSTSWPGFTHAKPIHTRYMLPWLLESKHLAG